MATSVVTPEAKRARRTVREQAFRRAFMGPPRKRGKTPGVRAKAVRGVSLADGSVVEYAAYTHCRNDGFHERYLVDAANGRREHYAGFQWQWVNADIV